MVLKEHKNDEPVVLIFLYHWIMEAKTMKIPEEGGLSSADILQTRGKRGSSNADVRTFWAKTFKFFENFGLSVYGDKGGGGLSQFGYFADKGRGGVEFLQLCADVFYGRSLNIFQIIADSYKRLSNIHSRRLQFGEMEFYPLLTFNISSNAKV